VHARRLEALSRAGIVERIADGVWKVPPDLLQRTRTYDAQKNNGLVIKLHSRLPIDRQVRAIGATWLDKQLIGDGADLVEKGFGGQVRGAVLRRVGFLAEQGFAERRGQRVILVRNLLATLRERELAAVGKALEDETGQIYRQVHDGGRASDVYRRSIQLVSGRFAVLDDGVGFSLVPWRPVVQPRLGQQVSAVVRGQSVSWQLGRQRGIVI
jgi:hypothetical protein